MRHLLVSYKNAAYAALYISLVLFLFISLATFNYTDSTVFHSTVSCNEVITRNAAGIWGAHVAAFLVYCLGFSAWFLIPCFFLGAISRLSLILPKKKVRFLIGSILLMIGTCLLSADLSCSLYNGIVPGGIVGRSLTFFLRLFLDSTLIYVLSLGCIFCGALCWVGFGWGGYVLSAFDYVLRRTGMYKASHYLPHIPYAEEIKTAEDESAIFEDHFWTAYSSLVAHREIDVVISLDGYESKEDAKQRVSSSAFVLPTVDSFVKKNKNEISDEQQLLNERARHLENKLELFGIKGAVVSITRGPVVTLFEYAPASDVKISKIIMLEDDLALALQAYSLRIIAPIPGRSVVGFEVANINRQTVCFNEIVSSSHFKKYQGSVPLIIGKDTVGADVFVDLVDMPHLLVAGSTGSGKSVALNAMLASMLCKVHPDEVKLILIDPKRLEFASFADIAHLLFPIITDMVRVPQVLQWAVKTMEERYEELAARGVRHIQDYHKQYGIAAMPFIVIVIDELADLMMSSSKGSRGADIEQLIARLSQMARAAGIHLILATQRPSVDVITGLIKVNFPSRIACKVISKVDSRTILDQAGAEKLLGKGDMLFLNHKGMVVRVHGAYVSDQEINEIVSCIKKQRTVTYVSLDILYESVADDTNYDEDPLYSEVCAYVVSIEQVSISLLQRKFRIGYNRSARLIDTLESRGILMPADGSKFRKVLRS